MIVLFVKLATCIKKHISTNRLLMLVLVGFALFLGFGMPFSVSAAAGVVTNLNNSGPGSLRQVIADAAPGDTITIELAGTIILTTGELVVDKDLSLIGPGAANLNISGNHASRVINNSAHLTISNLTIRDGEAGLGQGGGILNVGSGVLTIINSVIASNHAQAGAGIFNSSGGQLQVANSTFFANLTQAVNAGAANGAGIYNAGPGGVASITNSTFSTNNGQDNGSGLYNDSTATVTNSTFTLGQANSSAVYNDKNGNLQLNNVTITLNTGIQQATGLMANGGSVNVANSIIAGNITTGNNSRPDCDGKIISGGHNLIGVNGCNFNGGTGDLLGNNNAPINARLGALTNNGGPTSTYTLLVGSPAIDAGNPAAPGSGGGACEVTDQRGVTRPVLGAGSLICDIGAVEIGINPPPTNTATPTRIPATLTNTATSTSTSTLISVPATSTNTSTSTPTRVPATSTNTATSTPTRIPATPTNTATSTPTRIPSTLTNTVTSTRIAATLTKTATSTPTRIPETSTNTATLTPTRTPTSPTNTATSTPTRTPTSPTNTATSTRINPAVHISTLTKVPAKTSTSTPTDTLSNTPIPLAKVEAAGNFVFHRGNEITFGINVGYSNIALTPSVDLVFRDHGANIFLKATSFKVLNIRGSHAVLTGYATVNGKDNLAFILDIYDFGRHGFADKFKIQIPGLNGYTAGGTLIHANIQFKKSPL
ncbi:MAG: hypothetical protein NTW69_10530 [Chloroflexi bacterium]|nr:hypothetical protein [Chloroflexota bacterium]